MNYNCRDIIPLMKGIFTSKEKIKEEFTNFAKFVDKKYKSGLFDGIFDKSYKTYKGFRVGDKTLYCFTNTGIRFYCIVLQSKKEICWKVVGDDAVILVNPQDWLYLKGIKDEIRNILDE